MKPIARLLFMQNVVAIFRFQPLRLEMLDIFLHQVKEFAKLAIRAKVENPNINWAKLVIQLC